MCPTQTNMYYIYSLVNTEIRSKSLFILCLYMTLVVLVQLASGLVW